MAALAAGGFDAVLLDVMMPGIDGLSVLRKLRDAGHRIPVIMLTARGDEADRVVGLELGADDYVAKPFSSRELLARLRAVLRRAAPEVAGERLIAAGIVVDVGARRTGGAARGAAGRGRARRRHGERARGRRPRQQAEEEARRRSGGAETDPN